MKFFDELLSLELLEDCLQKPVDAEYLSYHNLQHHFRLIFDNDDNHFNYSYELEDSKYCNTIKFV